MMEYSLVDLVELVVFLQCLPFRLSDMEPCSSKEYNQLHSAGSAHMAKPAKSHQAIFCEFTTSGCSDN